MGNQWPQVNESSADEADRFRVGVSIAVLESQIDLACRHVSEWDGLEVFATADDKDHPAEAT